MAKTKVLISFAVTAKLICVFVFAYANIRFSHVAAHIVHYLLLLPRNPLDFQSGKIQSTLRKISETRQLSAPVFCKCKKQVFS